MRYLLYVCAIVGAVVMALAIAATLDVGYFRLYYGMRPAMCVPLDVRDDAPAPHAAHPGV